MSSIISPNIKLPPLDPETESESEQIDTEFVIIEESDIPQHKPEKVRKSKGHKTKQRKRK